jgi:GR25 family glycosyltransferase involved in LPS biosynthesis
LNQSINQSIYLLEACDEEGSPYIALFEDDIVATDGWLHRTIDELEQAETRLAL